MPTYPTLPTTYDSDSQIVDGIITVRASNGSLKTRKLVPTDKQTFRLVHRLSSSQKTTLSDFYGTNAEETFDFVDLYTSGTHSVRFSAAPRYQVQPGNAVIFGFVSLAEV